MNKQEMKQLFGIQPEVDPITSWTLSPAIEVNSRNTLSMK